MLTPSEWAVLVGGLAVIVWINWYFFVAKKSEAKASAGANHVQEATAIFGGG